MHIPENHDQSNDSVDIVKYLALLWQWAWLILLAMLIAGGAAYGVSKVIRPSYQARTTVLVDMAPSNKSIDYSTLMLSSQLTQTYSQMLTKSPVLEAVALRLGLPQVDAKSIIAKPVTNTQLINIYVESTNPQLAADIANMIVVVFAEQIQSLQSNRFSSSEENLQAQMTDIENKIALANSQLAKTTNAVEKDRLETTIANYNQTYASLLQSYEQVRLAAAQTLSSIVQVEPAMLPKDPVRPRTLINVGIALIVSLLLSSGVIIAVDLLDDTIKTPEEVARHLGLPVLGMISHFNQTNGVPVTESQPLSPAAEAFRSLRTNVQFAGVGIDKPLHAIMVTSAMPGEGKTEVLVNLGVVFAQMGLSVLLMDADLRRPMLHRRLELENFNGLSQFFVRPDEGMDGSIQPTRIHNLSAITAGDLPPNPSELLGSQYMASIMAELKTRCNILLIDTPPALAVTDSAAMMSMVEGVLLVIRPGTTRLAPIRWMVEQFQQKNANILGVVLNDVDTRNASYGYYYRHYYKNYDTANKDGGKRGSRGRFTKKTSYSIEPTPLRKITQLLPKALRKK